MLVTTFVKASGFLRHLPILWVWQKHRVPPWGWVTQPPLTQQWAYGQGDAHQQPPAVADLSAAIHVGQDERKGLTARRDNGWDGMGWEGIGWEGIGWDGSTSPEPAMGLVPGELGDRGPVVAIREAEEGDGLQETLLLLLLALQQVLTLE